MTDNELLAAIIASSALNVLAIMVEILINNSRVNDLRIRLDAQLADVDSRFDKLRDLWKSGR